MDTNKIFIDMDQRAHEFAEMCERMANETKQKEDPEAWEVGVRFECLIQLPSIKKWHQMWCYFEGNKEDYREVPQEVSASECQKALERKLKKGGENGHK